MRKLNPFKPSDYTGCQLWLDGADPNGTGRRPASGTVLTSWTDKSGSGNTVTLPSLTYSLNTYTGYPGVVFTSGTASSQLTLTPFECFFSSSYSTGPYFPTYYPGLLGQTNVFMYGNYYTVISANVMGPGGGFGNNSSAVYGDYKTDSRNMTVSGAYSTPPSSYSLRVGSGDGYPSNSWLGHIYEVIVFSNALNTRQRQQVEGYMCQKWGTVSYLPAGHPGRTGVIYPHNLQLYSLTTGQATLKPYIRLKFSLITSGLLARYRMNESSGSTVIDSVAGNNITIGGSPSRVSTSYGIYTGYALSIQNASQYGYITVPSNMVVGAHSITSWVYFTGFASATGTQSAWVGWGSPAKGENHVAYNNGTITIIFGGPSFIATTNFLDNNTNTVATQLNTWYFCVTTWDGTNTWKTYCYSPTTAYAFTFSYGMNAVTSSSIFGIGISNNLDSFFGGSGYGGYVGEVRFYNRVLNAGEVASIYSGTS